jgi:MarR family transcriptional regulator, organic hydroperoxide resistance regulator
MAPADAASDYELDPVLDFMRLLWSIEHGLQRMSKRMESEIGITGPQRQRQPCTRAPPVARSKRS